MIERVAFHQSNFQKEEKGTSQMIYERVDLEVRNNAGIMSKTISKSSEVLTQQPPIVSTEFRK